MMARKSTAKTQPNTSTSSSTSSTAPLTSSTRRGTTATALRSPESNSKKILYIGKLENGEPTPGVKICGNFWEAFFHEVLMTLHVARSNELLSFLELNDPFRAVSEDNVQLIQFLADTKPESLNNVARDLRTPLHFAVLKESKVLVEYLVKNVKPDLQDSGGNTPLLLSLIKGANPSIIETLINCGANVNAANKAQQTPLHIASEQGYKNVVALLLEKGAKIDVVDSQQRTPIVRAIQKQFEDIALLLIENNASLTWNGTDGNNLLLLASACGASEVVRVIIEKGFQNTNCSTIKEKQNALHLAAKGGHHKTLEQLVTKQIDFNATDADGLSPLMIAVIEGHIQCVEILAPLSDINLKSPKNGFTALHFAVQKGNIPLIRLLIEKFSARESEPDFIEMRSPLHIIPRELPNRAEVVGLLVKLKAEKNLPDKHGCTPLHIAVKNSDEVFTKALINSDIKLNVLDEDGNTPLHLAMFAKNDRKEIISLLLRADASVGVLNKNEETPLHAAAVSGDESCFCMLLCKDPDVNCKNRDGNTPLHLAAELGHTGVVTYLHNYGCDLNVTNKKGLTPVQLAVAAKHEFLTMYLLDLGAQISSSIKSKVKSIRETSKKRKDTLTGGTPEASKVICILMKKPENEVIQTIKINRDSFNNVTELKNALVLRFASVAESKNMVICFHSELGDFYPLDDDTPFRRVKIAREIRVYLM